MSGVPLFWPFDRCFRLFGRWTLMRTGHYFETQILTPVLAVASTVVGIGTLFLLTKGYTA